MNRSGEGCRTTVDKGTTEQFGGLMTDLFAMVG